MLYSENTSPQFLSFLKDCLQYMFTEGIEDQMGKAMIEIAEEGKMDYEEIFNIWEDCGELYLFSQSDLMEIAYKNGLNELDVDYIMQIPQIRELEVG